MNQIYIGNLPYETTEEELRELVEPFGEVIHIKMPKDFETGRGRGFAFITFDSASEAIRAITSLAGIMFQDRVLKAARARPKIEQRR